MRAAIVGGAAYHAGKRVEQGRQDDYERDMRIQELEAQQQQQQYAAPPPPAAAPQADMVSQLERLAALKQQGILSDAEFEAQKQKLLAGGQ